MTVIIGLSGKKRSGKNTVYYLTKLLLDEDDTGKVSKVAFGDALKEMARGIGWNGVKDDKGRRLLQVLGTQVVRECIDSDYWVKAAIRRIEELAGRSDASGKLRDPPVAIIIPDMRFPNEAEAIKKIGGKVWRIRRPIVEPKPGEETVADLHESETALDHYDGWDAMLVANNMEECFQNVKRELTRLGLV